MKRFRKKAGFTLAEGATHVGISDNYRKSAFTLAEVLITLGIIGIVSAMTIPTLIKNYQEKVTVTKLKKMYSTLSNAYQLYKVDNPAAQRFPISEEGATRAFEVFKPYLKIAKDCGTENGYGCVANGDYKFLNGSTASNYTAGREYYKILLSDGASIIIRGAGGSGREGQTEIVIFYDVNGPDAPNIWGRDLFSFYLFNDRILPYGGVNPSPEISNRCLGEGVIGDTCAAWIIYKGNLDYLKCPGKLTWRDSNCPQ